MFHNKVIRDPVHDIIEIKDRKVWDIINSTPFQRLRRIKQLGVCSTVFPGADHSRFSHSLGVYHLSCRLLESLKDRAGSQSICDSLEENGNTIRLAALCHDLGHGPFSHLFEDVLKSIFPDTDPDLYEHEQWTVKIISSDLFHDLFNAADTSSDEVAKVIRTKHELAYVNQIISSQLDVDRFDYLLRDSLMTGAQYGRFDLEWMLLTLTLAKGSPKLRRAFGKGPLLAVDGKRGLSVLEQYLTGRYYMHVHVYFHKTIRSAELLLVSILKRAAKLIRSGGLKPTLYTAWQDDYPQRELDLEQKHGSAAETFSKLVTGTEISVKEYLSLDDVAVIGWIKDWSVRERDPILRDLSLRFIQRQFFRSWRVPDDYDKYSSIKEELDGIVATEMRVEREDVPYYFLTDMPQTRSYSDFFDKEGTPTPQDDILYLNSNKVPTLLHSNKDLAIVSASDKFAYRTRRWCLPKNAKIDKFCEDRGLSLK